MGLTKTRFKNKKLQKINDKNILTRLKMKIVNHQHLIEKLAEKLKGTVTPPSWAEYVKTGHGKQRPPIRADWWYVRSAAILLSVQKLGPIGVSKLSVKYGVRKNKGYKPEKFSSGSTNIIRKILQQLEAGKLIKHQDKDVHKGKVLTTLGLRLINECSKDALKNPPVKKEKKVVVHQEKPQPQNFKKDTRDNRPAKDKKE
jgi:small subunit ribosomal protein S19e